MNFQKSINNKYLFWFYEIYKVISNTNYLIQKLEKYNKVSLFISKVKLFFFLFFNYIFYFYFYFNSRTSFNNH